MKRHVSDEVCEHLYEITLNERVMRRLNVKLFSDADEEWLHFVLTRRKSEGFSWCYDMVIGSTRWNGEYDKKRRKKRSCPSARLS